MTLVLNLRSGAVVFVGDGKGAEALDAVLEAAAGGARQGEGRGHRHVQGLHPGGAGEPARAIHVFDHFHVIKLFNEKLTAFRRDVFRELTATRAGVGRLDSLC